MGNNTKVQVYCDTTFFAAIFGVDSTRFDMCNAIVDAAKVGMIELFTSSATITETAILVSGENGDDLIDFLENDFITLVEVDRAIATQAHKVFQEASAISQAPRLFDALHLATAIVESCGYFFTYDDANLIGLTEKGFYSNVKISKPFQPWEEVAQLNMLDAMQDSEGITIKRTGRKVE